MINLIAKVNILQIIGSMFFSLFTVCGRAGMFALDAIRSLIKPPFYFKAFFKQIVDIGYYSLPVVGLTALFTGAVLALQSYTGFSRMNATSAVASVVGLSITRELGPVLAGLILAGRVSAAVAAEIGTMRVTEQIDALYTLHTNPMQYLIVPRVLAGTLMLPILVIIADIIGIFGGYLIAVYKLNFSPEIYLINTINILEFSDVMSGVIKAFAFGFIVSLMGCFCGYFSGGGAQGVGRATTSAVVVASVMILLTNYIITGLLFVK